MADSPPAESSPPKKKRFQFKHRAAPAARSPPKADSAAGEAINSEEKDTSLDLFRQSKVFFPKAVEEREQRVQAKKERREAARKESLYAAQLAEQPDRKRQKLSVEAKECDDDDIYGVSDRELERREQLQQGKLQQKREPETNEPDTPSSNRSRSSRAKSSSHTAEQSPTTKPPTPDSPSGKGLAVSQRASQPKPVNNAISLLSSDDEDEVERRAVAPQLLSYERAGDVGLSGPSAAQATINTPPEEDDDDPMEEVDPEFQKYIIQARNEKAQHGNVRRHMGVIVTSKINPREADPPTLRIGFLMNKALGDVRKTFIQWAQSRGQIDIPKDKEDSIVLTWKKNRIYDVTTGLSLGIGQPDEKGFFLGRGGYSLPSGTKGFMEDRVHLEAWDKAVYNNYLRHRDEERARRLAGQMDANSDDIDSTDDALEVVEVQQTAKKLRLTLKSRNHEPVRLSAQGDTEVAVLVAAFRKQRNIGPEQKVTLQWDGDTLDEATTLDDADIGDEDTLDVHIS